MLTVFLFFAGASVSVSAATPGVILSSPDDGNVSLSENVTFVCNASADSLTEMSLYTDIGGWSAYETIYYGELTEDSNTLLLCNFTGYECSDSTGTDSGTGITAGKIGSGVFVDGSDTLTFSSAGNFDVTEGSIDMWVKPEGNLSGEHWLFIVRQSPTMQNTEYRLWIVDDVLYFRFIDDYGSPSSVWSSVSSWNPGEWHHVAATWKASTNSMELYVDSSTSGNSYNIGTLGYMGAMGDTIYVGSYKLGTGQFNGTIDEFSISDHQKTGSEINDSYMTGLTNVTSAGHEWTISSISDGEYLWSCMATDNASNTGWNDTNRTLYVDKSSPPVVNSITTIPNTTGELDPGVSINVTANLSDPSGVNASILMYRRYGTSTWSNVTMNNITLDVWNGSFSVPLPPGTWEYAIWYNDSNGYQNQTAIMNVSAEYDYSWSLSPSSLGTTYVVAGETGTLGDLQITNIGEYPLNFNISSTWGDTSFNVSDPDSFDIGVGQSKTINVTVISSMTPYEYAVNITIGCTTPGAGVTSSAVNASLISYIGGPQLTVTMTNYPVSVLQSQSGIVFNATIKNIGNETANDTWINWTFPAGWSNSSGNLTYFAGNITATSTIYSNIVMTTSSSAAAGVSQVYLNASSNQTYNGSDSTLVGVSCSSSDSACGSGCTYLTDSNCAAPTGGDGGTSGGTGIVSGGGRAAYYRLELKLPERLDLFRGDIEDVEIVVENTNNIAFPELVLSSEGYRSTLISLYSGLQNGTIEASSEIPFTLRINVPGYMAYGEYPVTITATAYGGINTTVEGSAIIRLFVHSLEENETIALFKEAQAAVDEMNESGILTAKVSKMIESISSYLDEWDYDKAGELSKLVIEYRDHAMAANVLLDDLDTRISYAERYGLPFPETTKLYSLANSALGREDFQRAEERAESALLTLAVETGGLLPVLIFIETEWLVIILAAAGISVLVFFGRRIVSMSMIERKVRGLAEENAVLEKLIKEAGHDYFVNNRIGKDEYKKSMEEYNRKYSENKREEIRLSVRKMLLKSRDRKTAEKRRTEMLRKLMIDTQKVYFDQGKMTKAAYNSTMREISREIADMESKSSTKALFTKAVAVSIILLIMMSPCIRAGQQDALDAINAAEGQISEMESLGFGTDYANGTLNEARFLYSEGYYAGAESLAKEVGGIKESAIRVNGLVDEVESKLYDVRVQDIDVSEPEDLFNRAVESFNMEDFVTAESLLEEAYAKLDELEERASLERALEGGFDVVGFVSEQWVWIVVFSVVFVLSLFITRRATSRVFIRRRLAGLERERDSISGMIRDIQKMYFRDEKLGKIDYSNRMERYKERLIGIKKDITILRRRLR